MPENTTIRNLTQLLPRWLRKSDFKRCLLEFHVSFFDGNESATLTELNSYFDKYELSTPAFLRVVNLRDFKISKLDSKFSKPIDGFLTLETKVDQEDVPPGMYVVLGAPFADGSEDSRYSEASARSATNALKSLLSITFGPTCAHSKSFELHLNLDQENYSLVSPTIENPSVFRMDHLNDIALGEIFEILEEVADTSNEVSALLEATLGFVTRAIDEVDHGVRLSLYFTALEVLAGTTSENTICKELGISHSELRAIGYNTLKSKRNDFVHQGQKISLRREEERLLQYLVLDLICRKVGRNSSYSSGYNEAVKEAALAVAGRAIDM